MTEPIFFESVPSLPDGMSYHVDGVQTANGKGLHQNKTKGITAASYAGPTKKLSMTLKYPLNALTAMVTTSPGLVRSR